MPDTYDLEVSDFSGLFPVFYEFAGTVFFLQPATEAYRYFNINYSGDKLRKMKCLFICYLPRMRGR